MTVLPGPAVDRSFALAVAERAPTPYHHDLTDHPLLGTESIAGLAERLGTESVSSQAAVKPLLETDPAFLTLATETIADSIRNLAVTDSWFTLLNIEQDPPYHALVDEILDGLADRSGLRRTDLRRRMGFVFASSPGSITPAHFDVEHSLLMQLSGHRTLSFGAFPSAGEREREIHRMWTQASFGRMESMPVPTTEVELGPGVGAYIPPYTPHWITNGDLPSLSLTVTFYERSNEDESAVQVLNERLRGWGVRPRAYGERPGRDRLKASAMRGYAALRRRSGDAEPSRSH
ncbi:MAG: JmjC domain-containing protein [Marmoricola sp.]